MPLWSVRKGTTPRMDASLAFLLLLMSCAPAKPFVIGFAASLSGKDYMLGVEGRNAALLFVNDANASGGIAGRTLRLEIRDLKSEDGMVVPTAKELVDLGSEVIVGYYTSGSAVAALSADGRPRVPLVSPSATSSVLSGKADGFYRTIMGSENDVPYLVGHMESRKLKRVALVASSNNRPYVETYAEPLGRLADLVADIRFMDIKGVDYSILERLKAKPDGGYDAIMIVASSLDTGTLAQELAIRGLEAPLYVSGWAGNDDLVVYGGRYVDGAVFVHQTDPGHPGAAAMAKRYREVYGSPPGFSAVQTWDAFLFIAAALEKDGGRGKDFAASLDAVRMFDGLDRKSVV